MSYGPSPTRLTRENWRDDGPFLIVSNSVQEIFFSSYPRSQIGFGRDGSHVTSSYRKCGSSYRIQVSSPLSQTKLPHAPTPVENPNGAIAAEASKRCCYHPDRSRVCNRSGSLARNLQNHGNTALTPRWYASHVRPTEADIDVCCSEGWIPTQELDIDTRVAYLEPWTVQG